MKTKIENTTGPTAKLVQGELKAHELLNAPIIRKGAIKTFWSSAYQKTKRVVEFLLLEDEYLDEVKTKKR